MQAFSGSKSEHPDSMLVPSEDRERGISRIKGATMNPVTATQSVSELEKQPASLAAVDLRSDTVTRPTPEMRRAMAEAVVGDDCYGEDPTVNRLQSRAAEILGREAALLVPTGSMGNLVAIKVWTHHGNEVICEERGHINQFEMGAMSGGAGGRR